MTRTIKTLVAAVTLTAAVACSDATPTDPSSSLVAAPESGVSAANKGSSLTFSSNQSRTTWSDQTAMGGVGAIDFSGSLMTGNPCYDVTASHRDAAGSVTVTVRADPNTSNACIQVITYNNYQGRVMGLASGTYTFTVVHEVNGTSTTAYSGNVLVL
jgi:hypothetical protein